MSCICLNKNALYLVLGLLVVAVLYNHKQGLCICLPWERVSRVLTQLLSIENRVYFVRIRQFELKGVAYLLKDFERAFYLVC